MSILKLIVPAVLAISTCDCAFAQALFKPQPTSFRLLSALRPMRLTEEPQLPDVVSKATYRSVVLKMPWVYVQDRDGHVDIFRVEGKPFTEHWKYFQNLISTLIVFPELGLKMLFEGEPDSPTPLRFVRRIANAGDGCDLKIVGDSLVLTKRGGLKLYSLAVPSFPHELKDLSADANAWSYSLVVDKTTIHVLGEGFIATYDISSPSVPTKLALLKNGLSNTNGCVHGNRLYVAEAPSKGKRRTGVAVYEIQDHARLVEVAFAETKKTPYHLFIDNEIHLIACADGRSRFHTTSSSNIRVHGTAAVFELNDAGDPRFLSEMENCGGRSAAALFFDKRTYLVCNGTVFESEAGQMKKSYSFYSDGSTLDGAPYHGSHDGQYAALATDHNVFVIHATDTRQVRSTRQCNLILLARMLRLL